MSNHIGLTRIMNIPSKTLLFPKNKGLFVNAIFMSSKKTFTAAEAKIIGEKLGIKWDRFDVEQFRMGMNVELEHGTRDRSTNVTNDDPLTTGKIALAHLTEFPDYYDRLDKLEEEAKIFWAHKN